LIDAISSNRLEGTHVRPRASLPPGPAPLTRLGVTVTEKRDYDASDIARWIESSREDVQFFCDTSLFDNRTDARIWDALLGCNGCLVIIPPVYLELAPWLASHPAHPAARAVAERNPAIQFLTYEELSAWKVNVLTYYANLLGIRKHLVRAIVWGFEQTFGRQPDEAELAHLKQELHESAGPRAYLLARKGADTPIGPNFFTDELLVCLAALTAITTGRETVVLTKDEDVQEQFYKLQWLLDTHYRGMLLADLYAIEPLGFLIHALPEGIPHMDEMFLGVDNVLIERSRHLLDDVLPTMWTPVPISCSIIGTQFSHMGFVAERGMERLLRIKGTTGGLNTDRLRGRNCHIWLAPLDVPKRLRGCAAIAVDVRVPVRTEPVALPMLDVQQAILTQETVPRVVEYYPELVIARDGWLD